VVLLPCHVTLSRCGSISWRWRDAALRWRRSARLGFTNRRWSRCGQRRPQSGRHRQHASAGRWRCAVAGEAAVRCWCRQPPWRRVWRQVAVEIQQQKDMALQRYIGEIKAEREEGERVKAAAVRARSA
jgi:hypothetical protein